MKNSVQLSIVVTLLLSIGSTSVAQLPEFPKPEKEHQWLQKFVGTWKTESEGTVGPDQPPMKAKGTMTVRSVGGFWIVNEMQAEVMETSMTGIQTIGYDAAKKKYVGTWIDSMSNHMWHYEGSVDDAGKKLTLDADGPNFETGETTKFRDAYEFVSDDKIIATSSMQGEDGKWNVFMTGEMIRTKP